MKWDLDRELIAQVCHVNIRTVNAWLSQGARTPITPEISFVVLKFSRIIILERFDELPDFLQILLSPIDDDV